MQSLFAEHTKALDLAASLKVQQQAVAQLQQDVRTSISGQPPPSPSSPQLSGVIATVRSLNAAVQTLTDDLTSMKQQLPVPGNPDIVMELETRLDTLVTHDQLRDIKARLAGYVTAAELEMLLSGMSQSIESIKNQLQQTQSQMQAASSGVQAQLGSNLPQQSSHMYDASTPLANAALADAEEDPFAALAAAPATATRAAEAHGLPAPAASMGITLDTRPSSPRDLDNFSITDSTDQCLRHEVSDLDAQVMPEDMLGGAGYPAHREVSLGYAAGCNAALPGTDNNTLQALAATTASLSQEMPVLHSELAELRSGLQGLKERVLVEDPYTVSQMQRVIEGLLARVAAIEGNGKDHTHAEMKPSIGGHGVVAEVGAAVDAFSAGVSAINDQVMAERMDTMQQALHELNIKLSDLHTNSKQQHKDEDGAGTGAASAVDGRCSSVANRVLPSSDAMANEQLSSMQQALSPEIAASITAGSSSMATAASAFAGKLEHIQAQVTDTRLDIMQQAMQELSIKLLTLEHHMHAIDTSSQPDLKAASEHTAEQQHVPAATAGLQSAVGAFADKVSDLHMNVVSGQMDVMHQAIQQLSADVANLKLKMEKDQHAAATTDEEGSLQTAIGAFADTMADIRMQTELSRLDVMQQAVEQLHVKLAALEQQNSASAAPSTTSSSGPSALQATAGAFADQMLALQGEVEGSRLDILQQTVQNLSADLAELTHLVTREAGATKGISLSGNVAGNTLVGSKDNNTAQQSHAMHKDLLEDFTSRLHVLEQQMAEKPDAPAPAAATAMADTFDAIAGRFGDMHGQVAAAQLEAMQQALQQLTKDVFTLKDAQHTNAASSPQPPLQTAIDAFADRVSEMQRQAEDSRLDVMQQALEQLTFDVTTLQQAAAQPPPAQADDTFHAFAAQTDLEQQQSLADRILQVQQSLQQLAARVRQHEDVLGKITASNPTQEVAELRQQLHSLQSQLKSTTSVPADKDSSTSPTSETTARGTVSGVLHAPLSLVVQLQAELSQVKEGAVSKEQFAAVVRMLKELRDSAAASGGGSSSRRSSSSSNDAAGSSSVDSNMLAEHQAQLAATETSLVSLQQQLEAVAERQSFLEAAHGSSTHADSTQAQAQAEMQVQLAQLKVYVDDLATKLSGSLSRGGDAGFGEWVTGLANLKGLLDKQSDHVDELHVRVDQLEANLEDVTAAGGAGGRGPVTDSLTMAAAAETAAAHPDAGVEALAATESLRVEVVNKISQIETRILLLEQQQQHQPPQPVASASSPRQTGRADSWLGSLSRHLSHGSSTRSRRTTTEGIVIPGDDIISMGGSAADELATAVATPMGKIHQILLELKKRVDSLESNQSDSVPGQTMGGSVSDALVFELAEAVRKLQYEMAVANDSVSRQSVAVQSLNAEMAAVAAVAGNVNGSESYKDTIAAVEAQLQTMAAQLQAVCFGVQTAADGHKKLERELQQGHAEFRSGLASLDGKVQHVTQHLQQQQHGQCNPSKHSLNSEPAVFTESAAQLFSTAGPQVLTFDDLAAAAPAQPTATTPTPISSATAAEDVAVSGGMLGEQLSVLTPEHQLAFMEKLLTVVQSHAQRISHQYQEEPGLAEQLAQVSETSWEHY